MTDAMRETFETDPATNAAVCCPLCGSPDQTDFFEMPQVPVDTCMLWDSREEAHKAALGDITLSYCGGCGFVFNRIYNPSLVSFRPGYEASLIHSDVFRAFQYEVATRLIERHDLRNKTIVEIGCGAGDFLRLICALGGNTGIGFDPSLEGETIERMERGSIQLIPDYYSAAYREFEPDFVCCLSVFEDIPDPPAFLEDLKAVVGDRRPGIYFEIFNAFHAFQHHETWSIHYEQCNYFGLTSFRSLFERTGFEILDAGTCYEGDQYLYVEARPLVDRALRLENEPTPQPMPDEIAAFAEQHRRSIDAWRSRLADYRAQGTRAVVWGSGGKGTSFLNSLDSADVIPYVVDINPNRQNRHVGGSGQLIVPPAFLQEHRPDAIIITNPLYEREIKTHVHELGVTAEFLTI